MATVAVSKRGACDGCSEKSLCFGVGDDKSDMINAANPVKAKVGDMVEIAMPEGIFVKTAMLLYLMPVIVMIAGAFLLPMFTTIVDPDFTAITGSVIALILSVLFIKAYDKHATKSTRYTPQIKAVVTLPLGQTCAAKKN